MSTVTSRNKVSTIDKALRSPVVGKPWIRNPSWPALTAPGSTDEKFVALFAVYPSSGNFCALLFTTSSGNYNVDWGDTTSNSTATNVQANKSYSFSDANLAGTDAPATLNASADTVERTAHGYVDGLPVILYNIVSTTGVTQGQTYFVVNSTANDFQISATVGGSAINMTTNGTCTLLPYKIAQITVTCVTGGAKLTNIDLNRLHTQSGFLAGSTSGWLEIKLAHTGTTPTLTFSGANAFSRLLENVVIVKTTATTGLSGTFPLTCSKLARFELIDGSALTNLTFACSNLIELKIGTTGTLTSVSFSGCTNLPTAPFLNTASVTSMTSMFSNCKMLTTVPLYNTASVTSMANMFSSCSALTNVPLFNTVSVTSMSAMFSACSSLTTVPLFNTAAVLNMSSMFSTCTSLISVPLFNTAAVTDMNTMFSGCISITTVPLFNTAAVTAMNSMFNGASSLITVPLWNVAAVTNMNAMFNQCVSMTSFPLWVTTSLSNVGNLFTGCTGLRELPAMAFNSATTAATTIFSNCKLSRIGITGIPVTHTIASNILSGAELDSYYTGLPTISSQTITVTGNYGITGDTPTIATAKGWTVTGS